MSDFDDAMGLSDEEALNSMGSSLYIWHSDAVGFPAQAIVLPVEIGGTFRTGGRAEVSSIEVEISTALVRQHTVKDGWKVRWNDRNYRISSIVFQDGTATLICGAWSDISVRSNA